MDMKDNCRGQCLRQSYRLEHHYVRYKNCNQNCNPVRCNNFEVCNNVEPKWVLDCHSGRCMSCDVTFYKNLLIESINDQCPICLEDQERMVTMPGCTHKFCIFCFRKIWDINISNTDSEILINEADDIYESSEEDNINENNEDDDEIWNNDLLIDNCPKCPMCRHHFLPSYHIPKK